MNVVLAPGLFGFNAHRRANGFPWNITIRNGDKGGNPATKTAVHRTVMQGEDFAKVIVDYD